MSNKLALIFGGSRGIGAACVSAFASSGFDVAYTHTSNKTEPAKPQNGVRIQAYSTDICELEQVARVFDDAKRDFGTAPHCVVANAGVNVPPAAMGDFSPENFRKLIEVNVVGAFNVLHEAARNVVDAGSIIALTTSLVRHAAPGLGPYSATKAAVECMIRSMAKELAVRKVRVNAVAPGPVDTDLYRAGKTDEAQQRSAAMSPFNRVGTPDEIAEVICFLASDKSSWIHGQIIQPNGGLI